MPLDQFEENIDSLQAIVTGGWTLIRRLSPSHRFWERRKSWYPERFCNGTGAASMLGTND